MENDYSALINDDEFVPFMHSPIMKQDSEEENEMCEDLSDNMEM